MMFGKRQSGPREEKAGMAGESMTGGAWMSDVLGNYEIGYKLGLRRKQFGKDQDPEAHAPPPFSGEVVAAIDKHRKRLAV